MPAPPTLIIIVNWNKAAVLETMLTSLEVSGPREFDAVLVDNASTDNSVAMVREKFPWIHLIENLTNLGGTGGFNTGLLYGLNSDRNYEFFWLLDNDVVVQTGAYGHLLDAMSSDPRIGMVGSCILLMDQPEQVQECGGNIDWATGQVRRGYEGPLAELPDQLLDVDFAAACSLLVRTEAVRQVGIWDLDYFLLWDDIEWGVRIKRADWRVAAAPLSRVQHESYDNRRGQSSAVSTYLTIRNQLYFNCRFAPAATLDANLRYQLRMVLAFADNFRANGRIGQAEIIERALADFLENRMGRPPADIAALGAIGEETSGSDDLPSARRVAVLCRDNPDVALELHRLLQLHYGDAQIDTILVSPRPEFLQANLPRVRVMEANSFSGRVRLALACARQYDLVAAPAFMPEFFAERCARWSVRFDTQSSTWRVRRRDPLRLLWTLIRRAILPLRASWILARARRIRKLHVDYRAGIDDVA